MHGQPTKHKHTIIFSLNKPYIKLQKPQRKKKAKMIKVRLGKFKNHFDCENTPHTHKKKTKKHKHNTKSNNIKNKKVITKTTNKTLLLK